MALSRRCAILLWLPVLSLILLFYDPDLTYTLESLLPPTWEGVRCPRIRPLRYPLQSSDHSLPPLYKELYEWEDNLPQHNLDLPLPEGRHGRYLKFSNQIKGLGWNNVLNELYGPHHWHR
jgi:hypothetical protein